MNSCPNFLHHLERLVRVVGSPAQISSTSPTGTPPIPFLASNKGPGQALARAYGVRYVVAPAAMALDLPVAIEQDGMVLFEIPAS